MHREEAEKDILNVPEGEQVRFSSGLQSFLLPFRKQYRSRTILALFVLGMVQLSGIDGILYVSILKPPNIHTEDTLTGCSAVCTSALSPSRSTRTDSRISSLWRLSNLNATGHYTCRTVGRQMEPAYVGCSGRYLVGELHGPHWHSLRCGRCAFIWNCAMGCDPCNLHLRLDLLRHVGHRWKIGCF